MARVITSLTLGLLAVAASTPTATTPPRPGACLLLQRCGPRSPLDRAQEPHRDRTLRGDVDLQDSWESPDPADTGASPVPDAGHGWHRPHARSATSSCLDRLLEAPKTGPPSLHTS